MPVIFGNRQTFNNKSGNFRMKKSDSKAEEAKNRQVDEEPDFIDDSTSDIAEVNSIQEFIELKKLQKSMLLKIQ